MHDETSRNSSRMPRWETDEDIIVTGMSGRFPESDDIEEFWKNLIDGMDMVREHGNERWQKGFCGLPTKSGLIKNLEKFDTTFFGISPKHVDSYCVELRMMLEVAYEAIIDAGYNPSELRGKKIGVYIGGSKFDVEKILADNMKFATAHLYTGSSYSMMANRISFVFDFKGPSYFINAETASGLQTLDCALRDLRTNRCEAAFIGATNITLYASLAGAVMNLQCQDGKTKVFDDAADGYARSEAVVGLFLQRVSKARRYYAKVVHAKARAGLNMNHQTLYPPTREQQVLMEEVLSEACVDPENVMYVEANGVGLKDEDAEEITAVGNTFCRSDIIRNEPLLIGSIKSNMGFADAASGLCSLVKVLLSMETGLIPPNLHYTKPNSKVPYLYNGQIKVVTEPTPWKGNFASVSSMGRGGVQVYVLLQSNPNTCASLLSSSIPRLVMYCGRTKDAVQRVLECARERDRMNEAALQLLDESSTFPVSGMPFRGYSLLAPESKEEISKEIELSAGPSNRPVWFVFGGFGSQRPGMGLELMKVNAFANSIQNMAGALKPFGIDLVRLITHTTQQEIEDVTNCLIVITAIQIALVDLLGSLKIRPDGIIGHSAGEVPCAYAANCLTAEETLFTAYWTGRVMKEAELDAGAMAAIAGLSIEEVERVVPEGVVVGCHNSRDSVTVSGPENLVKEFVSSLQAKGIFAKLVDSCGFALHSPQIDPIKEPLINALKAVLKEPKRRPLKWISTSIPEINWNTHLAKHVSAEYYFNNARRRVLFEEAMQHIPDGALVIELSPHSMFQGLLKKSLMPDCKIVGLTKRNSPGNLNDLLRTLGQIYMAGVDPNIGSLYPKISYPVPRGTAKLSGLIHWDHSQNWFVFSWTDFYDELKSSSSLKIDISDPESPDQYLTGHCIDNRILFPAMGYLEFAWKTLARIKGTTMNAMPVIFENCKFHRATILQKSGSVTLTISIHEVNGDFEIATSETLVCSGRIYVPSRHDIPDMLTPEDFKDNQKDGRKLTSSDIYKEFRLRGYNYDGLFKGIVEADMNGERGKLKWQDNIVSFLDTMFHFHLLSVSSRDFFVPTGLRYLAINPTCFFEECKMSEDGTLPVVYDYHVNTCVTKGIAMRGLKTSVAPRKQCSQQEPLLEKYEFVPYFKSYAQDDHDAHLIDYIETCTFLAKKLLTSTENNNAIINSDQTLIQPDYREDEVILSVLRKLSLVSNNAPYETMNSLQKEYNEMRHKDIINRAMLTENVLRLPLDIVFENIRTDRLNIVEIADAQVVSRDILKILRKISVLGDPNYTVAIPKGNQALISSDLEALGIHLASWNCSDMLGSVKGIAEANLVIFTATLFRRFDQEIEKHLRSLYDSIPEGCFVLLPVKTQLTTPEKVLSQVFGNMPDPLNEVKVQRMLESIGFVTVFSHSSKLTPFWMLLRKAILRAEDDYTVLRILEDNFDWVNELKRHIASEDGQNKPIWIIADGSSTSGVIGMVNCLKQESGGQRIRCIFNMSGEEFPLGNISISPYKELFQKDIVMNVIKDGQVGSYRHISIIDDSSSSKTGHAYLNVLNRGDLSSFRWFQICKGNMNGGPQNCTAHICEVYYSALNFRDVMIATGKLSPAALPGKQATQECLLGAEFSGRDTKTGKRIMGIVSSKGLATTVEYDPTLCWEVPKQWTLQDASTVPLVYATAYYALIMRGKLKEGQSILIHSGSGGVGQAAIAIALSMNCEVYVTVGSAEKRDLLKKIFPRLKDENFANSRDTTFEDHVMTVTKGRGVDVVLNSLAEEKLQASLRCVAIRGRFLEIGKYDLSEDNKIGMSIFLRNIAFHGVLLDSIFESGVSTRKQKAKLVALLQDGINSGVVKPLSRIVFDKEKVEEACRFMASGKHIGKVILKIRDEDAASPVAPSVPAVIRTSCDSKKSYIITGGLGGFGLELAWWLISRGARKIVLTSRSGVRTGYQQWCINRWKEKGIDVVVSKLDVGIPEDTQQLLRETQQLAPIGGIFHLAMVLHDAFLINQTPETFAKVYKTKAFGAHNLDQMSRKMCSHDSLDWFVVFSSLSSGRGNPGQSNYGYASSSMERICEQRKRDGLPGLAIQWGLIGDVGIAYETMGGNNLIVGGSVPQKIDSCLSVLDRFLRLDQTIISTFVKAERFTPQKESGRQGDGSTLDAIVHVLGIKDLSSVNFQSSLGDLGLDSLMTVEVKQILEQNYNTVLSIKEIRMLTLKSLKEMGMTAAPESIIPREKIVPESGKTEKVERLMPGISLTSSAVNSSVIRSVSVINMNDVKSEKIVFFVHCIEGTIENLMELASMIPFRAIGLQCTRDTPSESIESLAAYYVKIVQKLCPQGVYNIAGYSFGALVAFEMAIQLGAQNVNTLVLIDGSPLLIKTQVAACYEHYQFNQHETEMQELCSFSMWQKMEENFPQVKEEPKKKVNFDERCHQPPELVLNKMNNEVRKRTNVQVMREMAVNFSKTIEICYTYNPKTKYTGNVVLIKAASTMKSLCELPADYGLSQNVEGKILEKEIDGNHLTIVQGPNATKVAKVISSVI